MIPVLPSTNPPCQSIVETLGFQSPHVDMSDQIFHTFSAGAVLSTEVPYAAIARSFLCAGDCRPLSLRRTGPPEIDQVGQATISTSYGAEVLMASGFVRATRCLPYSRYVSQTTTRSKTVRATSPMENAKVNR